MMYHLKVMRNTHQVFDDYVDTLTEAHSLAEEEGQSGDVIEIDEALRCCDGWEDVAPVFHYTLEYC